MTEKSILEGCEVLCLSGDLIACPLSPEKQKTCLLKLQYLAGRAEVAKWMLDHGRRECTYHYDRGRFIIDDLEVWDDQVKEWIQNGKGS